MIIHRVQKSGNSFYVVIPREYLRSLGLRLKDYVIVKLKADHLEMQPVPANSERKSCHKKKK